MRLLITILVLVACAAAQQTTPSRALPTPEVGGNLPAQPVGPNDLIAAKDALAAAQTA